MVGVLLRTDTFVNIVVPSTEPVPKCTWQQVLAAISVSLGSLVIGFASGYTSPAIVSMSDPEEGRFFVSEQSASWIGGIMPLLALFGGIAGGPCIEIFGRKKTIFITAPFFIIGWLMIAFAIEVFMVFIGRGITGFCIGIASLALPVYLGETVQPEVRGTLGLMPSALGNMGILVCFAAGTYLNWWALALLGAILTVPFLVFILVIPETPRWYISKGKDKSAAKALQWLRGNGAKIGAELDEVKKSHEQSMVEAKNAGFFTLFKVPNRNPLLISIGLMLFQQLSGINAVIFYTVLIFQNAGSTINENLCTIIVGIVNLLSSFLAAYLIDRLGRKILLYISSVLMILTLSALGLFFLLRANDFPQIDDYGWVPLVSFIIYVVGFSLGWGPIPWLMMGEILPANIRGPGASIATAFNWTCTFVVTKTFTDVIALIGQHGAFWSFGVVCVVGLFFVIFFVPETQGRSLEDIEKNFQVRTRRISSIANMRITPINH